MNNAIKRNILAALIASVVFTVGWSTHALGWTMTADFEQGTVGQQALGASGITHAFSGTTYSNSYVHSGSLSAQVYFPQGSDTWGISGGYFTLPSALVQGNTIWYRSYVYFKSPWSWTCNPVVKLMRVHVVQSDGTTNEGHVSIFFDSNGQIIYSNEITPFQPSTGVYLTKDEWQELEIQVTLSTTSPMVRIWRNGTLVYQDSTHPTMAVSTDLVKETYLFTYWNGTVPQSQDAYVDDIVITSDPPSNRDAKGNAMIGLTTTATPSAPYLLSIQ